MYSEKLQCSRVPNKNQLFLHTGNKQFKKEIILFIAATKWIKFIKEDNKGVLDISLPLTLKISLWACSKDTQINSPITGRFVPS